MAKVKLDKKTRRRLTKRGFDLAKVAVQAGESGLRGKIRLTKKHIRKMEKAGTDANHVVTAASGLGGAPKGFRDVVNAAAKTFGVKLRF